MKHWLAGEKYENLLGKKKANIRGRETGKKGKYSLYLGEKISFLRKGGGSKIPYFGKIYTPVLILYNYYKPLSLGEAREVHHMCVLLGFGVDAICPYMVFEIAHMLRNEQLIDPEITDHVVYENYAAAVDRGISKVFIGI